MTERERWIVYPLLFLALGAALRDKLVDRTTTKSIVCQELTIVDEEVDRSAFSANVGENWHNQAAAGGKSSGTSSSTATWKSLTMTWPGIRRRAILAQVGP